MADAGFESFARDEARVGESPYKDDQDEGRCPVAP